MSNMILAKVWQKV